MIEPNTVACPDAITTAQDGHESAFNSSRGCAPAENHRSVGITARVSRPQLFHSTKKRSSRLHASQLLLLLSSSVRLLVSSSVHVPAVPRFQRIFAGYEFSCDVHETSAWVYTRDSVCTYVRMYPCCRNVYVFHIHAVKR